MVDADHDQRRKPPSEKPVPPEKPLPSDCCDSGCERCVFDVYAAALARYERLLAEWEAAR
jgi:hypothetical protein